MPHYFQRYAQRENWVTNSTLLLLSRLYHYNRRYFEKVLNSLLLDSTALVNTEVAFDQQLGGQGGGNVIDGLIRQSSFAIAIETKLNDNQSEAQLTRHLESLREPADTKVLMALSVHKAPKDLLDSVKSKTLNGDFGNLEVVSATYEGIISAIQVQLKDQDVEMQEILDDYIALCQDEKLVDLSKRTMLVVPVGASLLMNRDQRIYYHPVVRNTNRPFEFLALYQSWHLRAAGRIAVSVAADMEDGHLIFPQGKPDELTKDQEQRIRHTIENTEYYNLRQGLRFYLLEDFVDDLKIRMPKVVQGKKYLTFDQNIDLKSLSALEQIEQAVQGERQA